MRPILKFCFSAYLLLYCVGAQAQIVYNFPGFNNNVQCFAEDADYVYIGGNFDSGSNYSQISKGMMVASTTGTGLEETGFPSFNGTVNVILGDGDGGWFVGGDFTRVGAFTRNRLVHILADKTVDSVWSPNANNTVYCLAISGTDLYVGGDFTSIGGQTKYRISKLSTTGLGLADVVWNPGANGTVYSFALSDTDLYIGGAFTGLGGLARNNIAKVSIIGTGVTDASWNPNANNYVYSIVLAGTNLYVGGKFSSIGGQTRANIAKLNTTNSNVDATWNPSANSEVNSLSLSGTDLYVGGGFSSIGGQSRNRIAKLTTTGTGAADAAWNPGASNDVYSLFVSGTDLYVSGNFKSIGGQNRGGFVRISNTGAGKVDSVWVGNDYSLTSTTRNSILVSGNLVFIGTNDNIFRKPVKSYLVRMSKTTNLIDASWNPSVNGYVSSIVLSGTDLYVGGDFTTIGGQTRNRIAKINTATALLDTLWNPNSNGSVCALVLSGSNLYVGGYFTNIGGQARNSIAKLSTTGTGTADAVWNPNANNIVFSLALKGTDLYVGGYFTSIGGQTRNYIAKLGTTGTGTADVVWNPNASEFVYSIAISGTDLYVGGSFKSIGGQAIRYIAKLDATGVGTVNSTWNPNVNDVVSSLALSGTDLYVGGFFTSIGGQARNRIAKLGTSGTVDPIWNPNADAYIRSILVSGLNVYLGGNFNSIQVTKAYGFAVVPTDLKISQTIIFSPLSARFFGGSAFNLFASGGASGIPVTFTSSNPGVATISGNTVTIVGVGTTTITASQAGNVNYYNAVDVAQTLTVNKGNQIIGFFLGSNSSKIFGDAPFTLSATGGGSGNPITFTSSNPSVATISGNTVTILGVGLATITASQAGNAYYNAATDVTQVLPVYKANQTITFFLGTNTTKTYGDAPFSLNGTATSGLPVTYNSSNTAVATVSGNTVTIVGVGKSTITASQTGNANYYTARDVTQTLTVVNLITALEDLKDKDMLVYPNPATDLLTIDVGDAKDCNIAIINSEGRLVSSGISTQGSELISVSVAQLPAGVYTLQISKNGETIHKRFVKQ